MKLLVKKTSHEICLIGLSFYAFFIPIMQNPYKPIWGESLSTGKLQIVDLIFILILPFLIRELFKNFFEIYQKYKLQIFGIFVYLLSIVISVKNFNNLQVLNQFASAVYLSLLFLSFTVVIKSKKEFQVIGKSIIWGSIINILLSCAGLILFYLFDYSWPYIIQENKLFPYLGEVVRLTGTFKPTAKFLSSYLTLLIPIYLALGIKFKGFQRKLFFTLSSVSLIIYPFTLSRGIVGIFFALAFLFGFLKKEGFLQKILFSFLSFSFVLLFIITGFFSTIHISSINTNYNFDNFLNHPSSVYYYYHPTKGREKISTEISFARDHYYWLKKAAIILFKQKPLGVGVGNFSSSVKVLEDQKLIPQNLSRHPTPQSEILFAASERGVLGLFSIIFLFFSWLYPLIKKRQNIIVFSGLGSLIALCFIDSLYLEITKFRFLWFFVGFMIVYSNNFSDRNHEEISN